MAWSLWGTSERAKPVVLVGGPTTDTIPGPGVAYGGSNPLIVGGTNIVPSANFQRPNDTTPYSIGDLVANSVTAGSVVPMSFTIGRNSQGGMLRKCRLRLSSKSITLTSFRIHIYGASPTCTNGDNSAWLTTVSGYRGSFDVTVDRVFSDVSSGNGVPSVGSEINFAGNTAYALIEARAAYAPTAQEVITLELEDLEN